MLSPVLNERQQRVVAAALTLFSLAAMVAILFTLFRYVLQFFVYFSGVFMPLAVAAILATLLRPYYAWLHARVKHSGLAVVLVLASLLLPLVLIGFYFGSLILSGVSGFINELPVWLNQVRDFVADRLPAAAIWMEEVNLPERLRAFFQTRTDLLTNSASAIGQRVWSTGAAVFNGVTGLLGWFVMPIYFAFLIAAPTVRGEDLGRMLPFLKAESRDTVVYLVTEFVGILVAFFRGQFVVALCQGILFAVGFSVVGLPHGLILGLLLGFLNIVPYLGNIIGLAVVIPLAWFHPTGGAGMLAGVMVVFVLVQSIESYFLTPRIMGKTTGLHPLVIVFAILFWGTAFSGLIGMVLAIPLTAFLVVFWRLLRTRYIREWL
jgi:predicted PurR-regulated permease PerM